jgi:SAM-dependent methyltransferase
MDTQGKLYNQDFYRWQKSGSYRLASVIVPLMLDLLPVHSVCDVGCGLGTWLACWRKHGVEDILGIDGDYVDGAQLMIPSAQFQPADLRQPLRHKQRFDLVTSMEVAEHLPPERAEIFVADLTSLAPVVLFSAAVPGQGGTDHINEHWQSYWAGLFHQNGFATFDVIRPRIWDNNNVEYWYRQNALVFCRHDVIGRYPALTAAATPAVIPLVHPAHPLGTRASFSLLRGSLRRLMARNVEEIWPRARPDDSI